MLRRKKREKKEYDNGERRTDGSIDVVSDLAVAATSACRERRKEVRGARTTGGS